VPLMRDLVQQRVASRTFFLYNAGLVALLAALLWAPQASGPAAAVVALATWIAGANLAWVLRRQIALSRPRTQNE